MKTVKKSVSILLALCMIFSLTQVAFAADSSKKQLALGGQEATNYPYVLVHGMLGWGENNEGQQKQNYWGFGEGVDIIDHLRQAGHTVAAPSVGPMSSAWDRACELYAQLTGTVVDYGAAHSAKYGHERYGRDYTGRALLGDGEGWDMTTKINLVSHSFGGPTVKIFTSLLEYGCEEEIAASPDDCSELFKGGHPGLVYSVSALASPHNGSTLANLIYDPFITVLLFCTVINIMGMSVQPKMDFMVDQWGITADPHTGAKANFSISKIWKLATAKDNDGYDMTLKGARELNEKFKTAEHTYFFSYPCDMTKKGVLGLTVPDNSGGVGINVMIPTCTIICALAGSFLGGEYVGRQWAANDGFVPVVSAKYPFTDENNFENYTEGMAVETGVWYVMPIPENSTHGFHVGGNKEQLYGFYDELTSRVNNINRN